MAAALWHRAVGDPRQVACERIGNTPRRYAIFLRYPHAEAYR